MNSSLILYGALLSPTIFRNGRREALWKVIEANQSVYPIIAMVGIAAVGEHTDSFIQGRLRDWLPQSRHFSPSGQ